MARVKGAVWGAVSGAVWIAPALLTLAACALTSGSLVNAAERLERSAAELSDETRGSAEYSRDAQEFAQEARVFRSVLADNSSDADDIRDAFRELSGSYHALRDEMDEAGKDSSPEFKRVTEAYLDLERLVSAERSARQD